VTSYDFETKKFIASRVTQNFASEATEFMYIKFEAGVFPRVTPEHPFFSITRKRWVKAKDLKPTEELLLNKNADLKNSRVLFLDTYKDIPTMVYNLEVDNTHNYFANNILVHNKLCRSQIKPTTLPSQ
jgi:intein/homing endonuclease